MKKLFFFLWLFMPSVLFSQINDDFEDGNISGWTESPAGHWSASSENPINGMYSLHQSYDNASGDHDQISVPFGSFDITAETTSWRFEVRHEYDPSSSNNWACFLFSDQDASQMYPSGTANGYAIGVDYSGSDDFIKIWKISSGSGNEILNTGYNWQTNIGTTTAPGIEVLRTTTGDWSVFIDVDGGFDNLVQIGGTVNNTDFLTSTYTGFYYEYSSSQDLKFYADNFRVGALVPDTDPPYITQITATSANTLTLTFNEDLDQTSAETITNYSVDGGIGNPASAVLNAVNHKEVQLNFSGVFTDNTNYLLTINSVEDLFGNPTVNESGYFSYVQIAAISASATSANTADVFFNRTVNITTAQTTANYSVDGGIGNPVSATVDGTNDKLVHLSFAANFALEQNYTLNVNNVEDTFGNTVSDTNLSFFYYETQAFDIVVNEIMNDVNPAPQAIPAYEYIEIHNNSAYDINLENWTLTIGTNSPKVFPAKTIEAHGYAIICEDSAEPALAPYGTTVGILNASELTITEKRILIKTPEGDIIEDITYSQEWYHDTDKDDGGWSMERIDPTNFCSGGTNWSVTTDYTGGTPGRENSVFASNPDNTAPTILQVEYISSKQLKVHFSENVKIADAENTANYILNTSINPTSAVSDTEDPSVTDIFYADNFPEGSNTIEISGIQDNCDNILTNFSGTFEYTKIYPKTVEVMSANQLRIHFSESVNIANAENTSNYFVNNSIGNPASAFVNPSEDNVVNLQFTSDFTLEQVYGINIQNISDVNDNVMNEADIEFIYYIPQAFDIVINEIMADINPAPTALPANRYIELYNTSDYDIDLTDWIFLSEGQTERTFPYITLKSNEYLILCEEGNETLFSPYGNVAAILTSSDITASGRNLKLMMPDHTVIEEVAYNDTWYNDPDKDDGGWSLERIDPTNFCGEENNWAVSADQSGGTPGRRNSVYASNQDNTAPEFLSGEIISSNCLILTFSENISYESGSEILNFSINNGIGNPISATVDPNNRTKVTLSFSNHFADKQSYRLMIENLSDNCDNSIQSTGYDFTYHRIHPTALWVTDENRLKPVFSETPDFETATELTNYFCDNGLGNPEFAARDASDSTIVHLQFANSFPDGTEVALSLSGIKDINGNTMNDTVLTFSYYTPKPNDIAINEILFNPFPDGSDFVELYNRTNFPIDLANLQLAKRDTDNPDSLIQISPLAKDNTYFESGTYLVFTPSKDGVLTFYMSRNEQNIFEIPDFPSFPDDEGTVVLLYKDTLIIDEFTYNEGMHFPLLDDNEGVSLERVNYDKPTQDDSNWHSASELVGFATPAYQNSQFNDGSNPGDDPVNIDPHVFSPDNDGYNDYANINFTFNTPDNVATVYIFDARGRIIKKLAESLLLSSEGTLVWDGVEENGRLAPAGTYVVYFKVFDVNGNVKVYKKSVILAKKI